MWAAVGAIAGGLLSRSSTRSSNAANAQLQREANQFTMQEGGRARKFASEQAKLAFMRESQFNSIEAQKNRQFQAGAVREAQRFDTRSANVKYNRDRQAVAEGRRFSQVETAKARQWEAAQAREQRGWSADQAVQAEMRARGYLDEDRAYNDPAAVRARLEAAGFNPLTGTDPSTGVAMGQPNTPQGIGVNAVSAAESGLAEMQAVQSGIASGAQASAAASAASVGPGSSVLATMQSDDFGSAIADAFASYENHQMQQAEQALRESQIALEEKRLSHLLKEAQMKPVVPGVYGSGASNPLPWSPQPASVVSSTAFDSTTAVNGLPAADPVSPTGERTAPDFDPTKPEETSLYVDVYDTDGTKVRQINPDIADSGPVELMTGWAVNRGLDLIQNPPFTYDPGRAVPAGDYMANTRNNPAIDMSGRDTRRFEEKQRAIKLRGFKNIQRNPFDF